ncbi:type II toxin-antitoxin system RelE/ParE family toxin [Halorubrum sp. CBA1125]|uniref:type II toxin-antitoxin system RelE family toxin n=1 Tax=Halorubrum sp. CBA1125 TaxID=2668072 RepID=UPI0037443649
MQELCQDYLTEPWNHPQVKYIPSEGEIWRLKVDNQGQNVDHRIFFDVTNNGLVFLTVQHRDNAYQPQK